MKQSNYDAGKKNIIKATPQQIPNYQKREAYNAGVNQAQKQQQIKKK